VTVLPLGTAKRGIEKIVFDPSMRPPNSCARHPNSFTAALSHVGNVSSSARRHLYSMLEPVVVWMTTLVIGMWMGPVYGSLMGVILEMGAYVRDAMLVNVTCLHIRGKLYPPWFAAWRRT
jgi:hypothetical protein